MLSQAATDREKAVSDRRAPSGGVCVLGLGVRTPLGMSVPATVAAIQANIAALADHPFMIGKTGKPMLVAIDPELPGEQVGAERFIQIGLAAAEQALMPVANAHHLPPLNVLIGLPQARPGLPHGLAPAVVERFRERLGERLEIASIDTFQRGHTAGLYAALRAGGLIRKGAASLCLVGGIESYMEPDTLEWIDESESLHGDTNPVGFVPGEAAGFCLLASEVECARLGLNPPATLSTVAAAMEKKAGGGDEICLGEGLTSAVRQVVRRLAPESKIDLLICDHNGEPERADEFGYTIVRTADRFVDPANVVTPADCWGDVGAASGPLFIALLAATPDGFLKGGNGMIYTSADGGERIAALVRPYGA